MSNITDEQVAAILAAFMQAVDTLVARLAKAGYTKQEVCHILSIWGARYLREQVNQ